MTTWEQLTTFFRQRVVPPVFLVFFTFAVQGLAIWGNPTQDFEASRLLGNQFSWTVVAVFSLWAFIFLEVPSPTYAGPTTSFGYTPIYQANGLFYYFVSIVAFGGLHLVYPDLSKDLYDNLPHVLGTLNIVAFGLCTFLLVRGKTAPQTKEKVDKAPILFEFYRGMELHPRFFNVDIKQWTNCRIGMMAWQLLILAYFWAGWERHGFHLGFLVNVLLQTIYIGKFFWWETGYFTTLDITLDRAGYYICWGCLVWVPSFYTFSSYYLVAYPPALPDITNVLILLTGLLGVALNYRVDYEKVKFRQNPQCKLWGKKAQFIDAEYDSAEGRKKTKLLVSGCWGVARHLNYDFELLAALCWCAPGYDYGIATFVYFFFLVGLLVHRVFRDEDKCSHKYGRYWTKYCQRVPYRMIPYVF